MASSYGFEKGVTGYDEHGRSCRAIPQGESVHGHLSVSDTRWVGFIIDPDGRAYVGESHNRQAAYDQARDKRAAARKESN